jgi:hypothetical protein
VKMKKLLILVSIFFYCSIAWAQTGKISGYVYNGSADSSIVPNIEVNLLVNKGHSVIDDSSYIQRTDAKGKFEFDNLKLDSTLIYYPRATFKSIVYYGQAARFTDKQNSFENDVVVYDTTSNENKIFFQLEHLFIDTEPGKLLIREIFIANNTGDKTFIGKNFDEPTKHYVLQFPLPPTAEDVEILTPEAQNWVRIEGTTLYYNELMSPGSRQFSYRFVVPFKKKEWQLTRLNIYPTGAVNIFVSNPGLTIEGPGVQSMGEFSIRGTTYQRYSVAHLMPGMELNLVIKNLPGRSIPIQWLVLAGVIVLLAAGFAYTIIKSKKAKP